MGHWNTHIINAFEAHDLKGLEEAKARERVRLIDVSPKMANEIDSSSLPHPSLPPDLSCHSLPVPAVPKYH